MVSGNIFWSIGPSCDSIDSTVWVTLRLAARFPLSSFLGVGRCLVRAIPVSGAEWKTIADLFTAHERIGRPRADDRLMLNGGGRGLRLRCTEATRRPMPDRVAPWPAVYQRFEIGDTGNGISGISFRTEP